MEFLQAEGSRGIYGIVVGPADEGSIVFVPLDKDPEEKLMTIIVERTEVGVPLSWLCLSLGDYLRLIEQIYQGLIKAGWEPKHARKILPKGIGV